MGVNVRYRNFVIATIPDSTGGTKTLLTEGKYLDDDVEVTYYPPSSPSLGTKTITANGTYNASTDNLDGYSQVTANVPNTYSASDEGKVVSSGALVAQTSDTVTANDTYDTTLINSLTVNVSGGGSDTLYELLTNTLTSYESDQTVDIKYGTFRDCTSLTSASFPNMTNNVKGMCFMNCTNLQTLNVRKANYIRSSAIRNTKITYFISDVGCGFESESLAYNTSLLAIDILGKPLFEGGSLQGNTNMNVIVLRSTSNVAQLNNTGVLNNTPFANGKSGGTLYVPNSMISSFQASTNWATIIGYTNNQIKAIEGSYYETHRADGSAI